MDIRVQVSGAEASGERSFAPGVVTIGRDSDSVLALPDAAGVSRHHAELKFVQGGWRIVDRQSANGTFVNERRVHDAPLRDGDRIRLAIAGPSLTVSLDGGARATRSTLHDARLASAIGLDWSALTAKGYLPAGLVTALALVGVWGAGDPLEMTRILLYYLTAASVFVVYTLCGKEKPWWLLLVSAAATFLLVPAVHGLLLAPFVGVVKALGGCQSCDSTASRAIFNLFIAAIPEELEKIAPVAAVWYFTERRRAHGEQAHVLNRLGVVEPLDGVLLAFASAAGFSVLEGSSYVLNTAAELLKEHQVPAAIFVSVKQGVARSAGHLFGHGAYSGIFGYFVGLAAMRPGQAREHLTRGFLIAIALHTAWNTLANDAGAQFLLTAAGYVILVSCILRGRRLSPARDENFATRLGDRDQAVHA